MNEITTVGVDLAKDVIVVCAGDRRGRPVYTRHLSFQGFAQWAANLPQAAFGLEACSSAHYWARWLTERGHTAKLMAAEHVGPFRMSSGAKNDRNDAQAILAAMVQPAMQFVAAKSVEAQAMLAVHTARQGWTAERTRLINRALGAAVHPVPRQTAPELTRPKGGAAVPGLPGRRKCRGAHALAGPQRVGGSLS
jgi:transposase